MERSEKRMKKKKLKRKRRLKKMKRLKRDSAAAIMSSTFTMRKKMRSMKTTLIE